MADLHPVLQRRPDEPTAAHSALIGYAALGAGRSLDLLAQQYRSGLASGAPPTRRRATLVAWSSRWDWQARVAEYDQDRAAAELAAAEARWAERREQVREESWEMSRELLERARALLAWPIEETVTSETREELPDGKTLIRHTTVIRPARWAQRDILTFAKTFDELARLAVGMDTEQRRIIVEGIEPGDLESLSDEELEQLLKKVEAKKRRRGG
jgi:hypothetical protein